MPEHSILFIIFLIFVGSAVIATLALYLRQSMLIAYIVIGVLAGPWGSGFVQDIAMIEQISTVGIIFLLFLLGMSLEPKDLLGLFKATTVLTFISATLFAVVCGGISYLFGYSLQESIIIGVAMMFSSTIIGLKLLPTTALHHQHMGELMVSILLMQDIIAILVLLGIQSYSNASASTLELLLPILALPIITVFAFAASKYVLLALLRKFDQIQEYIFLMAIAWCLGMAELAHLCGLSHEIGAFIAGVSLAISPIARFITESLKPLRDFFLIMFFFTLGASFNIGKLPELLLPAACLALIILAIKPFTFYHLLQRQGEKRGFALQTGVRLGQASEFALFIAALALQAAIIKEDTANLIQITTLITFILSSYFIVMRYPTPISPYSKLRKN